MDHGNYVIHVKGSPHYVLNTTDPNYSSANVIISERQFYCYCENNNICCRYYETLRNKILINLTKIKNLKFIFVDKFKIFKVQIIFMNNAELNFIINPDEKFRLRDDLKKFRRAKRQLNYYNPTVPRWGIKW